MPSRRPVPGQLLLTTAEFSVMKQVALSHVGRVISLGSESDIGERIVRGQVASVNQIRLGTPPGEIRRSDNGSIAHRTQTLAGDLVWDITYLADGDRPLTDAQLADPPPPKGDVGIASWRTIHPSTWTERVCEDDMKETP